MKKTYGLSQAFHCQNVISAMFIVTGQQIKESFEYFLRTIGEAGYYQANDIFYTMENSPENDSDIVLEIFVPVLEEHIFKLPDFFQYRSYFQLNYLIGTRVFGEDLEDIEKSLNNLQRYLKLHFLKAKTLPYYRLHKAPEGVYTDIFIGI